MDNSKKCPFCAEEISLDAIKCKHCKSMVNGGGKFIIPEILRSKKLLLSLVVLTGIALFLKFFFFNPSLYVAIAGEEFNKANYTDAISNFNKALKLDRNNIKALNGLGKSYVKIGNIDSGIKSYLGVIKIEENNKEALFGLLDIYLKKKDYISSEETADKLFSSGEKGIIKEYFTIGTHFLKEKDYKRSVKCFGNIVKIEPDNIKAIRFLSESYFALKDYKEAINQDKKIIKINPHDVKAHIDISTCYYKKSDYNSSIKWCEKALLLKPGGKERNIITLNLFNSYLESGEMALCKKNYEKARKDLSKARKIFPSNKTVKDDMKVLAGVYICKGRELFNRGSYEDATACFNDVLNLKAGEETDGTAYDYLSQIDYILRPPAYIQTASGEFIDSKTGNVVNDGRLIYLQNGAQPDENGKFDGGCTD